MFDYTYTGNILYPEVYDPEGSLSNITFQPQIGYHFTMRIDETQLLGGSLRNSTITWSGCSTCSNSHAYFPGLVALHDLGEPQFAWGQSLVAPLVNSPWGNFGMKFTTNEYREIISYSAWFNNGAEDDVIWGNLNSKNGDDWSFAAASPTHTTISWRGASGTWTVRPVDQYAVAPIPLPATAALMLAGLAAFGAIRRRAA